jgi:Zn-dependent protease/CBS domain-containing protein
MAAATERARPTPFGGASRRPTRMSNGSFTLGRLGGVEVRIQWSWLVILALLVWSLADGVFPSQNPGLSHSTYLAMAIGAALLFFASVLLHELGHAWQARKEGIEVDSITLWLFGGVTQFKERFISPGAEFRIAFAGPLVSIGLGVVFVALAFAGLPSAVDGVVAWVGYINLSLAVFNLVPALPLDGGRVFRAALWRAKGDLSWATRVAAGVGQGFGYLLIVAGLAMFVLQGSFSGAWFAFIGWFLLQAARGEARHIATEQALDGLRVRDLMVPDPVTVSADFTLADFVDGIVRHRRYATYPVVDRGTLIGLLPVATVASVPRSYWPSQRVRELMVPLDQVTQLDEDATAVDALTALSGDPTGRGLVVANGRLAGLLSLTDVAMALEVRQGPRR